MLSIYDLHPFQFENNLITNQKVLTATFKCSDLVSLYSIP